MTAIIILFILILIANAGIIYYLMSGKDSDSETETETETETEKVKVEFDNSVLENTAFKPKENLYLQKKVKEVRDCIDSCSNDNRCNGFEFDKLNSRCRFSRYNLSDDIVSKFKVYKISNIPNWTFYSKKKNNLYDKTPGKLTEAIAQYPVKSLAECKDQAEIQAAAGYTYADEKCRLYTSNTMNTPYLVKLNYPGYTTYILK